MPKGTGLILVIVESPGKIEKIQHILGDDYIVMASVGHIIDLEKGKMSIDFENNFKPIYKVIDGKQSVVDKIKKAFYNSGDLLIATDEDREGEMIAWSIANQLGLKTPKRIMFNSITKKELLEAVKKPGKINDNLVDAQKLRRILDRIIGYKLSPLLWKSMGGGKLSAGRVQSVVVKLIIEKENDIKNFFSAGTSSFFKTNGDFLINKKSVMKANLFTTKKQEKIEDVNEVKNDDQEDEDSDSDDESNKKTKSKPKAVIKGEISRIPKEKIAKEVMKSIMDSEFKVSSVTERESIRQPSAPFTTSTLQQEASRKFGFGSKRTMAAAQHLYEGGHITYMRTDSINLSDEALKIIGEYVIKKYGKYYHRQLNYKSKAKNTQEAHEAIRPTDPKVLGVSADSTHKISTDEIKLYTLIWKRAVASQMSPAKFNVTNINIDISEVDDYYFVSQVENNTFLGFLAVYNLANDTNEVEEKEDEKDNEINQKIEVPKKGTVLTPSNIVCTESYKTPPTRYNEASLVGKLDPKNLNIGRPSTYATIIDKIQNAGYVKKEDVAGEERDSVVFSWDGKPKSTLETEKKKILLGKEKNKFVPQSIGILVVNFLEKHFSSVMDYKFTADMENNLDDVADGKLVWTKVLGKFWKDFNPLVEKLDKTIVTKETMDENMRELGVHPKSGNKIVVTMARYGPVVKMTDKDNTNAILYAPIKAPLTLEKITLADAVELFEFPKKLGRYQSKIVSLQRGKYGYYLMIGTTPKTAIKIALKITDEEVNSFTIEKAISSIEEKSANEFWKGSDSKNRYVVLEGQYGKYINIKPLIAPKTKKAKAQNVKLPADVDSETLTVDKVTEIIANYNANRRKKKEDKLDKGCKDEKTKVTKAKKDETTGPKEKSTSTKSTKSVKSKKSDLFDVPKQKKPPAAKKTAVKKEPVKKEPVKKPTKKDKESTSPKKVTKSTKRKKE